MLNANEIVRLWEAASNKPYWQQSILLLAAAHPDQAMEDLARLSPGQRNQRLFRFRDQLFGTQIEANSSCPACTEAVEFTLDSQVICDPKRPTWDGEQVMLTEGDSEFVCHPPAIIDIQHILPWLEVGDEEAAAMELMHYCVTQYRYNGVFTPVEAMPMEAVEWVSEQLKTLDVHSEINCRLNCPACEHSWLEPFDITRFLWNELEVKAQIILGEVQLLAKAFGWWEGDILSLSDIRRKYYIEGLSD